MLKMLNGAAIPEIFAKTCQSVYCDSSTTGEMKSMFEMFVKQIGVNHKDGHPVVVLKEKYGQREMPIWVGPAEFKAIVLAHNEAVPDRPQTHDLMASTIAAVGRAVASVQITKIADSTFHATLCLTAKRKKAIVLECRPSDGIALALRFRAPILVAPAVLEAAGYVDEVEQKNNDDMEQFKKFIDGLKASDFAKLSQSKESDDTGTD